MWDNPRINCIFTKYSHCVMFYDLAPQNSHLFGNTFQKFKQLQNLNKLFLRFLYSLMKDKLVIFCFGNMFPKIKKIPDRIVFFYQGFFIFLLVKYSSQYRLWLRIFISQ
jgi:hypothetical protein